MAKKAFVYDGTQWVDIAQSTTDLTNYANMTTTPISGFRNAIINGDFRINQRGLTSSGVTGNLAYGFDRWANTVSGGTATMSAQTFTVGSPAASGYESQNFLRQVVSGQSASGNYASIIQYIEDVRTFAGATITVSFWAKAGSGTPKIALELQQNFGSGGSPSSSVFTPAGQVTLSTSWSRYSITITVPSISGKTIGTTANTSSLGVNLWTSAGSDFNTRSGSLGIQNNTFDFWGVQVERGTIATPFEQRPIGIELALCQRYYKRWTVPNQNVAFAGLGLGAAAATNIAEIYTNTAFRAAPTAIDSANVSAYRMAGQVINGGTLSLVNPTADGMSVMIRYTGSAGQFATAETVILIAGAANAYIGLSAEL